MTTTTLKPKREKFLDKVRQFNKKYYNRFTMMFAGRFFYAVVRHNGRVSGHSYATPILATPTPDGFIIPLPYGDDADWCLNILAAGQGQLQWHGKTYVVYSPEVVDVNLANTWLPRWQRFTYQRFHIQKFLRLKNQ